MTRSASTGITQTFAAGQQNQKFSIFFDHNSTGFISHDIQVDNDFFRLMAFNLETGESVTLEQVTGDGAYISDYAPIANAIVLTPLRTSYVIERPGRYRMRLNAALGHVLVIGFRYAMENESTQDIVDSINFLASQFPLPLTVCETQTVNPDITGNILRENVRISQDANNCLTVHADGLYNPCPTPFTPTACNIGNVISVGATQTNVIGKDGSGCLVEFPLPAPSPCSLGNIIPTGPAVNNVIGKDGSGCLENFPLVSSDIGNIITLRTNGVYAGSSAAPNRCTVGQLAIPGVPTHFIGIDASGCLVYFDISAGPGITFIYNTTTNSYTITNQCYPCGSPTTISSNLCATTIPQNLTPNCADSPGSETYNEQTVFTLSAPTGGTGPYTYDWSTAVGMTSTWTSGLGGTPTQTITPSGNTLTISATLSGANPGSGSEQYVLNIPTTAFVTIHDSASNSTVRYLAELNSIIGGNQCSTVTTVPTVAKQFTAAINCVTTCTPESANFPVETGFTTTGYVPSSGTNTLSALFTMNNNTANICCGGTITFNPNVTVQISDPLNTMGEGPTYTVPNSAISNSIIWGGANPGGSPGSDWPAQMINTGTALEPNMTWPNTPSGTPCHGPASGTGEDMQISVGISFVIPPALFSDGAHHNIVIDISSNTITAVLGRPFGNTPCCGGSGNSGEGALVLNASWG